MNEDLKIGLVKNQLINIIKNSQLSISTMSLLLENLTRDVQVQAQNAFIKEYEELQKKGQEQSKNAQETID